MQGFLTVRDIADRLAVTEETVRRWLRTGKLQGIPFGRAGYRIEEANFQAFLHVNKGTGQTTGSTAYILKVTAALSQALTAKQVANVTIRQALIDLNSNGGALFLLNKDRTAFKRLHIVGYSQATVDAWPGFPTDAPLPLADAVRQRKMLIIESQQERNSRYPHFAHTKALGGDGALVALPLLFGNQPVGGLGFNFPHDRTFSEDERAFLLILAELCAQSLERVRLYEELQHTNRTFQALVDRSGVTILQDVSERKQAEMALQENEERLRLAVDVAGLGMWDWHIPDNRLVWTDQCKALFGLPADTGISFEQFLDTLYPDDRKRIKQTVQRSLDEHIDYNIEFRVTWPDKSIHWIAARGRSFSDAQGSAVRMIGVAVDMTERKLAEAALQASEERYRTIVQTANEGIWLIDTQARTAFVNDRMAAMLGYTPAEMVEHPVLDFVFPEHNSEVKVLIDSNLQGSFEQFEAKLRRRDDNPLYTWASTSPVRDGSGTIVGALGMFIDMTERKRLEQRTHKALDALLVMAEGLIALHPSSEEEYTGSSTVKRVCLLADLTCHVLDCEGVIIAVFAPSTDIIEHIVTGGFEANIEHIVQEHMLGKHYADRFDDPHIFTHLCAGEVQLLNVARPPYRDRQPHQALLVPMRLGKGLAGVITLYPNASLHDYRADEIALAGTVGKLAALVIEREQLLREREEARAKQLALQETTRRMDEFIAIVSHELLTPLTTIKGSLQLAKRQLTRKLKQQKVHNEEAESAINSIEELLDGADRYVGTQNRLVHDLIDVSRIQANHLDLHVKRCDLVTIVREMIEDQRSLAPERTILLESDIPAVDILADAERVGQVVNNYISNALKYSDSACPVEVRVKQEGALVRVLVKDQGPGLALEDQQYIWDRFYRASGVELKSGTGVGLGLGLHICRTLIERQGGQVGVESMQGCGSTFWFTLPVIHEQLDTGE